MKYRLCFALALSAVIGFAVSCYIQLAWSSGTDTSTSDDATLLIRDVPHIRQKPDFCGEACIAMWIKKLGKKADQDWVFDQSGLDPLKGRGVYTPELVRAARAIGFNTGAVWYRIDASRPESTSAGMQLQWKALRDDLEQGVPSIVCMRLGNGSNSAEHFRLVLGYDAGKDQILFHDPAVESGAYQSMQRNAFLALWPLKYEQSAWTIIRLRLEGKDDGILDGAPSESPTSADFAQAVLKVKDILPRGFSMAVSPPFLVIGDESDLMINRWANGTVKWAADQLKSLYFKRELDHVITVWLFRDKDSYTTYTRELLKDNPDTPFGYYSPRHNALVMNIGTGGGTLVHEIVHPYMRRNFPNCPDWFNEGMGSLYEQSSQQDGRIVGLTNWRLAGLQDAVRNRSLPPFEELIANSDFYGKDKGTNYAQARYLCYYLQENDLLTMYYADFVRNQDKDPTGWKTLKALLGENDMQAFDKQWQEWVLKLRFP